MSKSESHISIDEHLSALLDDEAGSFEQRRVLDELKTDQKLSKKLSTYALISETMRTSDAEKPPLLLGSSFLDSLHDKIALEDEFNEVMIHSETSTASVATSINKNVAPVKASNDAFSWLRPVGGFAVAASVGALAFMGLQNMGVLSNPVSQPGGIVNSSAPTAIVQAIPVTTPLSNIELAELGNDDKYIEADAEARLMLKRYVDSHMQYATTSAFVPSVRVIAYTDNQ